MLGVLKRRLKPKRPGEKESGHGGKKNGHTKSEPIVPVDMARIAASQRQIHPLFEEKVQLVAYDDNSVREEPLLQLPRKAEVVHQTGPLPAAPVSPAAVYHPAPNICVEAGRIEFIKSPSEGSGLHARCLTAPDSLENNSDKRERQGELYQSGGPPQRKRVSGTTTTTRAQQTQADIGDFVEADEKCDIAKEFLEARIKELERLLEAEQKSGQRERLAVARLQRQLARREVIHRDVDRERRLRADTESRLRETVFESERYRATLAGLQREFSRMEDTVRTMLQYKSRCEILNQEKASLATAYESRVHQYQNTISKLNQENESLRHQLRLLETTGTSEIQSTLLERLRSLETENAHLSRDADFQRKQYEKCLDDIANQVVRALLSQKGLREEIGNLQGRIKELENQNHALANILVRKLEGGDPGPVADADRSWFPGSYGGEVCRGIASSSSTPAERRLHEDGQKSPFHSLETLLIPRRPRSLNLYLHASRIPVSGVLNGHRKSKLNLVHLSKKPAEDEGNESPESGNKDEGYSTMSSDVQGPGDSNELSKRELEDLKEASDETEMVKLETNGAFASVVLIEDVSDPDIFFIPFNFTLAVNPRHSYPPTKDFLPYQHIMRSFSDSHLCLKLNPNSPLLTTPFSPSMLLIDLIDKSHPLRKTKATNSLLSKEEEILREMEEANGSWCSGAAEGCWWDTEYVHHCLKVDDRKQQRDVLQLDYDNTELEDWSLSLSCEDIAGKGDPGSTPGVLPSIRETEQDEEEKDPKFLSVDTKEPDAWPYRKTNWTSAHSMESPGGSWSSVTSNNSDYCCVDGCLNDCGKRSSVVSDDAESSVVGTDFTRDFYRLVKFESTKSLASNSSRSIANGETNGKEIIHTGESKACESTLKNVLNFIVEQQQYNHGREEEDTAPAEMMGNAAEEGRLEEASKDESTDRTEECYKCTSACDESVPGHLTPITEEGVDVRVETPRSPGRSHIPIPKPSSLQDSLRSPQHRKAQPQKIQGSKIPVMSTRKSSNIPIPTRKLSVRKADTAKVVVADDGSFHERATSKDVIDELNRMIRKGEEITPGSTDGDMKPLDIACCCPTGWVHVERDIDFTDPKARANLLDVMLASSGSSGGSGSSSDSGGEDPVDYTQLHRIHRFRRQRKASATRKQLGVLRYPLTSVRPSIIGRENFFVRYGDKEREAIASFDFLEDLSTTSVSGCSSCDTLGTAQANPQKPSSPAEFPSPDADLGTPATPTTPSDDSEDRTGGQVFLSDSCADSCAESTGSEQC